MKKIFQMISQGRNIITVFSFLKVDKGVEGQENFEELRIQSPRISIIEEHLIQEHVVYFLAINWLSLLLDDLRGMN